ncbi:hypothetical protein TNCV_1399531 [Trichonephila clavipes]|nr:hypothetical protein TNCV_1399531 [Trichonephila clavipes]
MDPTESFIAAKFSAASLNPHVRTLPFFECTKGSSELRNPGRNKLIDFMIGMLVKTESKGGLPWSPVKHPAGRRNKLACQLLGHRHPSRRPKRIDKR